MFGLFKKKLPHCDELFIKYLSPWYDEDDRPKMTRPDMYQIAAFEGQPLDLDEIQYLTPEYLEQVKTLINETMTNAALEDFSLIHKSDKFKDRACGKTMSLTFTARTPLSLGEGAGVRLIESRS